MVRLLLLLVFVIAIAAPCFAQTAADYRRDATELARQQSWDQAIEKYRKALELEPNDALTHYNLALALKYKGDSRPAVDQFEAALRLKPKWGDAHYGLGATWYDLHEPDAAVKELRLSTALEPAKEAPHRLLARIYLERNAPSDAKLDLE